MKGMSTEKLLCCEKPVLFRAYVPCWPFRATHCSTCGDVKASWGSILQVAWDALVYPTWDGTVKVTKKRMTRGYVEPPRPWPNPPDIPSRLGD